MQFIQHCGKLFLLSVTLFPNTYSLMSSLLRLLNSFLEWPLLSYSKKYICVNSIASIKKNLKTSILENSRHRDISLCARRGNFCLFTFQLNFFQLVSGSAKFRSPEFRGFTPNECVKESLSLWREPLPVNGEAPLPVNCQQRRFDQ